jgi:hypothetical protein
LRSSGNENLHHYYRKLEFIDPKWVQTGNQGPLSPYIGPSRTLLPTREQGATCVEDQPPTTLSRDLTQSSSHSLQHSAPDNEFDEAPQLELNPSPLILDEVHPYRCRTCSELFSKRHLLKYVPTLILNTRSSNDSGPSTHAKKHDLPFQCSHASSCTSRFRYKKDLSRHCETQHSAAKVWYCPHATCKYSRGESKVFKRKDNFDRHIRTVHAEANQL